MTNPRGRDTRDLPTRGDAPPRRLPECLISINQGRRRSTKLLAVHCRSPESALHSLQPGISRLPDEYAVQCIVGDGQAVRLREVSGGPRRRLSNASRVVSVHFRAGRTRRSAPAGKAFHRTPFLSLFLFMLLVLFSSLAIPLPCLVPTSLASCPGGLVSTFVLFSAFPSRPKFTPYPPSFPVLSPGPLA